MQGHNGPLDDSNQSNDNDTLKGTATQGALGVEYVNVSSTKTNPEQEMYCYVDLSNKEPNDITGQNLADKRLAPPTYEVLTSTGRQRASQIAESEYSALEFT